jgi:hypothetical protein
MADVLQFRRPSAQVIKARKAEVARRYRWQRKHATKPQFAAIRLSELERLYTARHGEYLPRNDIGRALILIAAHHLAHLAGHPQHLLIQWAARRAPWLTIASINATLVEVATQPRTWKADTLARMLGLTMAERQSLKITTVGAIDCNADQRKARRRKAKMLRERARRAKRKSACPP